MSDQVTAAALRDELQIVDAFMTTQSFASFYGAMNNEYDNAIEKTLDLVPQNVGDTLEREQAIGEAKMAKVAKNFFQDYKEQLQQQLYDLEHPKETLNVIQP